MRISAASLDGVFVIEPAVYRDSRGFFMEAFHESAFRSRSLPHAYVQDNHSLSVESGTIRGLHYQLEPYAQTKLVRVLAGAVFDVAVDLRQESPTFGRWEGFTLSAENKRQLLVPKGFAHGFCTLAPNTEVLYKVDAIYSPEHERGILWSDPELAIGWPATKPMLSLRDGALPRLRDAQMDFRIGGSA